MVVVMRECSSAYLSSSNRAIHIFSFGLRNGSVYVRFAGVLPE
jgi:hypothetical protein